MTREKKLALLRQWEASYLELDLQMDRLSAVVGSMVHSPFGEAVWGAWDNYTCALAELVGDGYEWLNWYCFDNDMGKKAYEAGWEGDMRPITQATDLLWLIEGGAGDKEATWAEA